MEPAELSSWDLANILFGKQKEKDPNCYENAHCPAC